MLQWVLILWYPEVYCGIQCVLWYTVVHCSILWCTVVCCFILISLVSAIVSTVLCPQVSGLKILWHSAQQYFRYCLNLFWVPGRNASKIFKITDNVTRQSETFIGTMSASFMMLWPAISEISTEPVRVPGVTADPFRYKILKTVWTKSNKLSLSYFQFKLYGNLPSHCGDIRTWISEIQSLTGSNPGNRGPWNFQMS